MSTEHVILSKCFRRRSTAISLCLDSSLPGEARAKSRDKREGVVGARVDDDEPPVPVPVPVPRGVLEEAELLLGEDNSLAEEEDDDDDDEDAAADNEEEEEEEEEEETGDVGRTKGVGGSNLESLGKAALAPFGLVRGDPRRNIFDIELTRLLNGDF